MAKTRANAKTSAPPAKLNNKFVAKPKKNNKKKSASKTKQTEPQSKVKSPLTAVQLQSKSDKAKIVNHPTVEELLKLCCPVSIRLTRIEPNQSKENSDVKITSVPTVRPKESNIEASVRLNKAMKKSARSSNVPTLQQFIEAAYQQELKSFHESGKQLQIGDFVIARMKGYLPWPGRVESFTSNNKSINCFFYGTHNMGPVGSKNIMPFTFGIETIRLVCLRSPNGYIKGIKEIETASGVPEELSCINELKSIE